MVQGHLKKDPPFFLAWKFSSNASMHTSTNILDYVHAHLDGGGLYLDLPKRVILHLELEVLYWTCQALALQLEESTQVDLPIEERHDYKQMAFMVDVKQVIVVCQATKPKAKSGKKINKTSEGYFQAFERSYFFHSIFTTSLFSNGCSIIFC